MEENAIVVNHVSKNFRLPHERAGSVKSLFTGIFRKRNKGVDVQHALHDVSFEIKKGEFFGIVGRNGSGKSTMLKMLAGIYQPTTGSVHVEGKLVPFIELGVGFNPELTGRQNVYLNGALLGFSEKEIDEQYSDIVDFAELHDFMDQKLKNYSSGMQVRLAFSMAVRAKADVLLIDEVLAVGDADFQRKCFNYFNMLRKASTTVIFVSHNMNAVREYCDRAMLIEKSEVVEIGSTDSVSEKYLQLFMDDTVNESSTERISDNRWGDQAAKITKVRATATANEITIEAVIKASQDFERPIVGFRLRDAAGNDITGTNTKQEKLQTRNIVKDEEMTVQWKMPNVLRDGQYTVDIAINYPDEITVADWWDEAAILVIRKRRQLPYTVDPGFITTVK
jgi:ABC-2 type transport system ATP-binding protein